MATIEVKEVTPSGSVQTKQRSFPSGLAVAEASASSEAAAYAVVTEEGGGANHITKLVITGLPVTLANTTGISFGTKKLLNFPRGAIHVAAVTVADFSWGLENEGNATPIAGTHGGDISLGTTGTTDATLDSTDVNLLASTSYDPISTAISAQQAINAIFDGTATPISVHLNAIIDDADVADAASDVLEANATIYISWTNMMG